MRKQTTKWCLIEGENSEKQQVWRSVFKRNISCQKGPPLNKEILEIWEKYSQPAAVRKIQEEFEVLRSSPESCLRVKMFRLSQKCQKLRKQKRDGELRSILQSGFHAPKKKITEDVTLADESQIRQVQDAARKVVQENHKLKREIEHVEDTNENLSFQIEHYGKKLDIQMKLLDMMNDRYGEAMKYKRESHNLQHELELWQQKFQHISDQLDKTTNEISMLHEKVKKNSIRNLNKKLKRREKAILIKENKVNEIETELEQLKLEKSDVEEKNESLQSEVNTLKNDRKSLLVKICRLKKSRNFEMEANNDKIQTLRHEILEKENQIAELEEINEVLNDNEITSFYNGQYTSEVRQTIMTLVNELGVSQKKVNGVMKTVVQSLTGKTLSRLPSTGVLSRLRIEAKRVAQIQVAEAMVNAGGDASTVKGNCLHQDATSKFHRHFQSFQITTSDNVTYSLGLSEIAGGDSQTLFETFQENLSELSNALKHDQNDIAQLVSTIVATMSDQGAINPIFNKQLQELRESLMPDIVENWDTYSHDTKAELCKLSNYFCKMHVFVNMANEVDKCLNVFEKSVCMGSNPFSLGWSESGGARLVRTVSKALTMHGCEKSGIGQHFQAYLKNEDKRNQLVTFRGHRYNHLFCAAGRTYHHRNDIKNFLDSLPDPNDLLKSVAFDIQEQVFLSSVRALGIIDKLITGPFWREIECKRNILDLNPLLEVLQLKLEEYSKNSSALLKGETPFPDEMLAKDEVYHSLFEFENATIETYTQMALELATGGMLLILERQVKDQLKGGKYYSPDNNERLRAAAVPTTNSCSERDFAQLDVLMRLKPAASIECLESIIVWTNNETSAWLADKTKAEREDIIEQARKDTEQMQLKIKQKRNKLMSEKLKKLQEKQDRKTKKQEKEYVQTIKLTDNLTRYGGLWTTMNEVDFHLSQAKNENNATEALVGQLQFRKQILKSCGSKELFQKQYKGTKFSVDQLEENLKTIIAINANLENKDPQENRPITYTNIDSAKENVMEEKSLLATRIKSSRHKLKLQQQKNLLPKFIDEPHLFVGKSIQQKFNIPDSNEIEWFNGEILKLINIDGLNSTYQVKYEDGELSSYNLLVDFEKGDVIIL